MANSINNVVLKEVDNQMDLLKNRFEKIHTVSASMQPRGSIFQNWFLGEVLFKFDAHGVVFEMGFYYSSDQRSCYLALII